jgi:hypothetical protein
MEPGRVAAVEAEEGSRRRRRQAGGSLMPKKPRRLFRARKRSGITAVAGAEPARYDPDDPLFVAVHEAGRAVAATVLGLPLKSVDVQGRREADGSVSAGFTDMPVDTADVLAKGEAALPWLVQVMAGVVAEEAVNPLASKYDGHRRDREQANRIAKVAICTPRSQGRRRREVSPRPRPPGCLPGSNSSHRPFRRRPEREMNTAMISQNGESLNAPAGADPSMRVDADGCTVAMMGVMGCNGLPLEEEDRFVWEVAAGAAQNYRALGLRMAACSDLYRNTSDGHGLIQVLPGGQTRLILKAGELAPVIADRIAMVVTKVGKIISELPTAAHLGAMLRSELFLACFRAVDEVARAPFYLDDFSPVQAGYHDGGPGRRILYVGGPIEIGDSLETLTAFLDVMDFATNADRTNAVAAALTVLLRHRWPGEKPVVLVTATKSHAGKGTITEFLRGSVPKADILYESTDWPMQSKFQRLVKADPDVGILLLDNARLDSAGGRAKHIRSAFLESFVTSSELTLASPGAGEAIRLANKYVVVINTNDGSLSTDLHNRSLPIHLAPRGSVQDRRSPIGNPKLEFLPQNRGRIAAEFRGMIERWRVAGCPLDEAVTHSMTPWARAVGGIVRYNGFTDFLANRDARKATDEPIRRAVGILGAARPGEALRPGEWAKIAVELGLTKELIPVNERDTEKSRERSLGVLLSPLVGEMFEVTNEGKHFRLRLAGGNRRWQPGGNPQVRYLFEVLREDDLPVDA